MGVAAALPAAALALAASLLYLADQATDVLTALLYIQDGQRLAGGATLALVMVPGLAAALLELRGGGSLLWAALLIPLTPLWAATLLLLSLVSPRWRERALLLRASEAFLCAAPQLVLQISLWLRADLTAPARYLMAHQLNIFGREFSEEAMGRLGEVQLLGILLSLLSLYTSVLHYNRLTAVHSVRGAGKLCLGAILFLLTILYRAGGLALLLCFTGWWAAIIIFPLFFSSFLAALCTGDRFPRAALYGLWSLLAPVGQARHPQSPLGYQAVGRNFDITLEPGEEETEEEAAERERARPDRQTVERWRGSVFLTAHWLASLLLLLPALGLLTALVSRAAARPGSLPISTTTILPLHLLPTAVLPTLGLCLATSLLLVRPFHRADRAGGEVLKGTVIV